jgi:hypothetical protein
MHNIPGTARYGPHQLRRYSGERSSVATVFATTSTDSSGSRRHSPALASSRAPRPEPP